VLWQEPPSAAAKKARYARFTHQLCATHTYAYALGWDGSTTGQEHRHLELFIRHGRKHLTAPLPAAAAGQPSPKAEPLAMHTDVALRNYPVGQLLQNPASRFAAAHTAATQLL
jgi:hypothetical protein